MDNNQKGLFFLGIFLAIGLSIAGYFISQTIYNSKVALNTAEAKGLAERRVRADTANWDLVFSVSGKAKAELPDLYAEAEKRQKIIIEMLKEKGFEENEIEIGVIDYYPEEYRDENQNLVDQKHNLVGSITVNTHKVDLVAKVRADVNTLIARGIDIENRAPVYLFTKLNDIKPDMLREATKNARLAANEFAQNAGVTVGGIRSARQGSFYIKDAGNSYGDTEKIEKDVRVVTTITFYLTD
ncbi:putative periplasmic protein [Photobacterium marinum]|uniref:Putative periplasmic protein n=1 Tax=Photobacterium marinum TaxID=1056511 RepID=L8JKG1_9GAMM|nr:SIMPL domain-containing protein [Photobacterium marinum]ELR67922.1 putative periplasmic protein [Photobacterium marinum]